MYVQQTLLVLKEQKGLEKKKEKKSGGGKEGAKKEVKLNCLLSQLKKWDGAVHKTDQQATNTATQACPEKGWFDENM